MRSLAGAQNVPLVFRNLIGQIQWFWAAIAAGLVPAVSPLQDSISKRVQRDLHNLYGLFERPFILTDTAAAELDFLAAPKICTAPSLFESPAFTSETNNEPYTTETVDVACLCTSSGSTGSAKAIPVQHGKLIEAAARKNARFGDKKANVFLNPACDVSLHISLSIHELPALLCLADQVVIRNH